MNRLIIFTDFASLSIPMILTKAILQAVCKRSDVEIAGLCIINPQKYRDLLLRYAQTVIKKKIISFFDHSKKSLSKPSVPINSEKLARHYHFPIIVPPDHNINHSDFISALKTIIKPTLAISYFYPQKFSPSLLEALGPTVNYHNGLLPKYRGLKATSWSVYQREKETGYTFHYMNENFDEGNILLQGAIPIKPDAIPVDLEHAKTFKAANDIPRLLEMIISREKGTAQTGESGYFSEKIFLAITKIDDPSAHSSVELIRRLRAFGRLLMHIQGRWHRVTKLVAMPGTHNVQGTFSFRTRDDIIMQAIRFHYLPLTLYQILKWIGWRLSSKEEITNVSDR